jgi:hypothetical protein
MKLSIIIISYNTKDLLNQCLSSLTVQPSDHSTIEIIVVDNASVDGSAELVKQKYPQVHLLQNNTNIGFGPANNLAAAKATGEYVLFLNSDTSLKKNALSQLLTQLSKDQPDIASCKLINPDGSLQPQGGALPNLLNLKLWMLNLDHVPLLKQLIPPYQNHQPSYFSSKQHPGWVAGTAMVVKRSVFKQLNGFDKNMFMYAEDIDLCWRAIKHNYQITYWPKPHITHVGQGSSTSQNAILGEFNGLIYLYKKHQPTWQLPLLKIILKSGALFRSVLFAIIGQHEKSAIYTQALKLG